MKSLQKYYKYAKILNNKLGVIVAESRSSVPQSDREVLDACGYLLDDKGFQIGLKAIPDTEPTSDDGSWSTIYAVRKPSGTVTMGTDTHRRILEEDDLRGGGNSLYVPYHEGQAPSAVGDTQDSEHLSSDRSTVGDHLKKGGAFAVASISCAGLALAIAANMSNNSRLDNEIAARDAISQGDSETARDLRANAPPRDISENGQLLGTALLGSAAFTGYLAFGGLSIVELAEAKRARRRQKW